MADIYVDSAAVGLNDGTSWANAYTLLAPACTGRVSGDVIYVASTHVGVNPGSVTYATFPGTQGVVNLRIISVDKTSGSPPTIAQAGAVENCGAAAIGAVVINGGRGYIYGIRFQTTTVAESTSTLAIGGGAVPTSLFFDNCHFDVLGSNTTQGVYLGNAASANNDDTFLSFKNCSFRFGSVTTIRLRTARIELMGMSLNPAGATPSTLFSSANALNFDATILASDLSALSWTNLFTSSSSQGSSTLRMYDCLLPSGFTNTQSASTGLGAADVYLFNCSSLGGTQPYFSYSNALGSIILDTATRITDGPSVGSWRIVTTSLASITNPFITPWVNFRSSLVTAFTPRLEVLRNNGVAAAYTDAQVWSEWTVQNVGATNSRSNWYTDWLTAPLVTPVAQPAGAGTGAWTIAAPSSPFSFKLEPPAAVTPVVAGFVRARMMVGLASVTIRVDPVIRV